MQTTYRADIDGLRAIAVIPVILYHAGIPGFSGGYVGVDVFFVISGYLITSLIHQEMLAGRFSIVNFYERRIRRIFPALFAVILFSLVAGSLLFDSDARQELGDSVVATTLFGSNILFWLESGYFEKPSEFIPLLHTWSLGVEEQFYIFFPVLMLGVLKWFNGNFRSCFIGVFVISLSLSIYAVIYTPSSAFYLPHARFWELILGAMLALRIFPEISNQFLRSLLAGAGLLAIAFAVVTYDQKTAFPGLAALVPCLGAALIIYAGSKESSNLNNYLGVRPLVLLGLMSYSLYLWHWPLIVFAKQFSVFGLSAIQLTGLLTLTLLISMASWQWIEKPFRGEASVFSRQQIYVMAIGSMFCFVLAGIFVSQTNKQPELVEVPAKLTTKAAAEIPENNMQLPKPFVVEQVAWEPMNPVYDAGWLRWTRCQIKPDDIIRGSYRICNIGLRSSQTDFIVWGDSHAKGVASGLAYSAKTYKQSGKFFVRVGCPPVLNVDWENKTGCSEHNNAVVEYIKKRPEYKTVILVSRWGIFYNGTSYKEERPESIKLVDLSGQGLDSNEAIMDSALKNTVNLLINDGRRVVVVSPVPEVGYFVPGKYNVARRTKEDLNALIAPSIEEYQQRTKSFNKTLFDLQEANEILVVDPSKILCDENICRVIANDILLYRDDDHLSTYGSHYVSEIFDQIFNQD
jgi:peptidoglycan/LPS O-acetylase OafA/YrhL